MKRLNIDLEEELHKELKIKAAEGGYTISEYIRSQIEMLVVHKPDVVTYQSAKIIKEVSDYKDKEFKGNLKGECRNGHLTNKITGRCSQKDCKYS
ncbi:MAG: ParG [Patescibacteria group bacterium]|nr:ParG [Patescibacteria group bacterium]